MLHTLSPLLLDVFPPNPIHASLLTSLVSTVVNSVHMSYRQFTSGQPEQGFRSNTNAMTPLSNIRPASAELLYPDLGQQFVPDGSLTLDQAFSPLTSRSSSTSTHSYAQPPPTKPQVQSQLPPTPTQTYASQIYPVNLYSQPPLDVSPSHSSPPSNRLHQAVHSVHPTPVAFPYSPTTNGEASTSDM
ncbi:hypothetical protein CC78DRAFT_575209 [Lojkania enalia]|uniref:Uncharacterized protein n=1 Tax=Lojkania enalia TaxID=147567 RepID=A0A9P4TPX6_9PLEO|nr:hypothetical protein CC78DRAFT_575209 [Didymosphaeria enalia]